MKTKRISKITVKLIKAKVRNLIYALSELNNLASEMFWYPLIIHSYFGFN